MDVRKLTFELESFDVIIDKGLPPNQVLIAHGTNSLKRNDGLHDDGKGGRMGSFHFITFPPQFRKF